MSNDDHCYKVVHGHHRVNLNNNGCHGQLGEVNHFSNTGYTNVVFFTQVDYHQSGKAEVINDGHRLNYDDPNGIDNQ